MAVVCSSRTFSISSRTSSCSRGTVRSSSSSNTVRSSSSSGGADGSSSGVTVRSSSSSGGADGSSSGVTVRSSSSSSCSRTVRSSSSSGGTSLSDGVFSSTSSSSSSSRATNTLTDSNNNSISSSTKTEATPPPKLQASCRGRRRRPEVFDRAFDWESEKQCYVRSVTRHIKENPGVQDVMSELFTLMNHVTEQTPGTNDSQWRHPSDLTRRNYQIQFGNTTEKMSLSDWEKKTFPQARFWKHVCP